jgi:hypothetical protein
MDRWENRFCGILNLATGMTQAIAKLVCEYVMDPLDPPPDHLKLMFDIDRISPLLGNRRLSGEQLPLGISVSPQTRTPPRLDFKSHPSSQKRRNFHSLPAALSAQLTLAAATNNTASSTSTSTSSSSTSSPTENSASGKLTAPPRHRPQLSASELYHELQKEFPATAAEEPGIPEASP